MSSQRIVCLAVVFALLLALAVWAQAPDTEDGSRGGPVTEALAPATLARTVKQQTSTSSAWTHPRTEWGDPDLRGIFTTNDVARVPVQRPAEFGTRRLLTEEQFAKQQAEQRTWDSQPPVHRPGSTGAGPDHWYEWFGAASRRTSLVVDPPDGRFSPLTPGAQKRRAEMRRGQGPRDH